MTFIKEAYFEKLDGTTILTFKVNIKVHDLLQKFIINSGFDVVDKNF